MSGTVSAAVALPLPSTAWLIHTQVSGKRVRRRVVGVAAAAVGAPAELDLAAEASAIAAIGICSPPPAAPNAMNTPPLLHFGTASGVRRTTPACCCGGCEPQQRPMENMSPMLLADDAVASATLASRLEPFTAVDPPIRATDLSTASSHTREVGSAAVAETDTASPGCAVDWLNAADTAWGSEGATSTSAASAATPKGVWKKARSVGVGPRPAGMTKATGAPGEATPLAATPLLPVSTQETEAPPATVVATGKVTEAPTAAGPAGCCAPRLRYSCAGDWAAGA